MFSMRLLDRTNFSTSFLTRGITNPSIDVSSKKENAASAKEPASEFKICLMAAMLSALTNCSIKFEVSFCALLILTPESGLPICG